VTQTPVNDAQPAIRRAVPADVPHLGRLGALLVAAHHELDPRRFFAATPRTRDGYAQFLATQLDTADAAVFVAEESGAVIGYAYVAVESYDYMSLRGPAGVLHDIIVDPESRRHGVGRRLLEAAFEYVQSRGLSQIVLSTAEGNKAAQQLFAGVGFRRTMVEMTLEL
jgi:ribosomal protein S18 acetylase RimI-like enzyme